MYLHLGQDTVVRDCDIIGIFDLDITTQSIRTRNYLNTGRKARAEVRYVTRICPSPSLWPVSVRISAVYISQLSTATLLKRSQSGIVE